MERINKVLFRNKKTGEIVGVENRTPRRFGKDIVIRNALSDLITKTTYYRWENEKKFPFNLVAEGKTVGDLPADTRDKYFREIEAEADRWEYDSVE